MLDGSETVDVHPSIQPARSGWLRAREVGSGVVERRCQHYPRGYDTAMYPRNSCNSPAVFVTVTSSAALGAPFFSIRDLEEDGMNGLAESAADRGPNAHHQVRLSPPPFAAITIENMRSEACAR